MTDVERVQKVEEFLEANPQIETFLVGFLVGSLVSLAVYGVCYLFGVFIQKVRENKYKRMNHFLDVFREKRQELQNYEENNKIKAEGALDVIYWVERSIVPVKGHPALFLISKNSINSIKKKYSVGGANGKNIKE